MMTLTLVMLNQGSVIDIMAQREQRGKDVLEILSENEVIQYESHSQKPLIRSFRRGCLINEWLTFAQEEIYDGDILYIEMMEKTGEGAAKDGCKQAQ